jgi:hypothetical protein
MFSIKNNNISKFFAFYLSTNCRHSCFVTLVLFLSFLSNTFSYAQNEPRPVYFPSETYGPELLKYNAFKDSLPSYYYSYCLGGQLRNETEPEEEQLSIRRNIIAMPVLLGNANTKPFELWKSSIIYSRTKHENFTTKEEKIAFEKSTDPNYSKITTSKEEEIAIKQKLREANNNSNAVSKEEKGQTEPQQQSSSKNSKPNPKASNKKDKNTVPTPSGEPEVTFDPVPVELKAKMAMYGEEKGWEWLYAQQILAGNVLFCHPQTNVPKPLDLTEYKERELYNQLLIYWKKAYRKLMAETKTEEFKELAKKDLDLYITNYGKPAMLSAENMKYFNGLYAEQLTAAKTKLKELNEQNKP